jgi:hypothetical protein
MSVVDIAGEHVGIVELVKAGDPEASTSQGQVADGLVAEAKRAFRGGEPRMPAELASQLVRVGFVKVDGRGIVGRDVYVAAVQVKEVVDDVVHLGVADRAVVGDVGAASRWCDCDRTAVSTGQASAPVRPPSVLSISAARVVFTSLFRQLAVGADATAACVKASDPCRPEQPGVAGVSARRRGVPRAAPRRSRRRAARFLSAGRPGQEDDLYRSGVLQDEDQQESRTTAERISPTHTPLVRLRSDVVPWSFPPRPSIRSVRDGSSLIGTPLLEASCIAVGEAA